MYRFTSLNSDTESRANNETWILTSVVQNNILSKISENMVHYDHNTNCLAKMCQQPTTVKYTNMGTTNNAKISHS